MIKAPISLQDLRRRIYREAKADKAKRFWGMFVHIAKPETLAEAYLLARQNDGAPGIDGVTFDEIEAQGVSVFLTDIREQLLSGDYRPTRTREVRIPKGNGKFRTLSIPTIRDRVVEGALKLILEPVFEADFQDGSYGYRPKRTAHDAIARVADAIIRNHTRVIDVDLKDYFGSIRQDLLLKKVAKRIDDDRVMGLLKLILKKSGKQGIAQGGPLSPLLSNLYLTEVDEMLEKAKSYSHRRDGYYHVEYARFADDLVVLIDGHWTWDNLPQMIIKRLAEEFARLGVTMNREKTKMVDLTKKEVFTFLGFNFYRGRTKSGKTAPRFSPAAKGRTKLFRRIKEEFDRRRSQPVREVIRNINPIIRGWVNYFRIGHSSDCFTFVKNWIERKVRRHLMRARKRKGFGWKRWSKEWLYAELGLYNDYQVRYFHPKAAPVR